MRNADKLTVIRIAIVIGVIYATLLRFNPWVIILAFLVAVLLDGLDGFAALSESSNGKVGFSDYISYSVLGDRRKAKAIGSYKRKTGYDAKYGPRFDIAADRITELSFWGLFVFLHILPLYLLIIILIRHSVADALMGARGTSSKMRTRFARIVYSSSLIGRAGINVMKFVTFSYLILVYILAYPITIGYVLTAILVAYIMLRGAAEVYESVAH